jgi:peptidoglycan L-alanyl-D-glutamate endopeptidase CwlK
MAEVMRAAITDSPVAFTITCGVRTAAEQKALYAQGRTAPGKIVTNCDGVKSKSAHQAKDDGYGHAVDLYPSPGGAVNVNDVAGLKKIAGHIKSVAQELGIDVVWGGDWKMRDYPHFELG